MKRPIFLLSVLLGSFTIYCAEYAGGGFPLPTTASADEGWRSELENLCNRTNEAATFTRDHLQELVTQCDRLKPRIEALDESSRKVYGKRLQLCRDFYAFMLQSKSEGGVSKESVGKQ